MAWLALVGCFAFGPYDYNSALWTMPTEFWGSLMVFAVYRGLPGTLASREGGLVVAALAIALGWNTNFAGFAYGIALFEVMRRLQPRRDRAAPIGFAPVGFAPAGFALFGAGLVLGGMPYVVDLEAGATYARIFLALAPHVQNPVALLHGLAALCLVAAVLLWRPLQVGLMTGLCQFLGRVSFSLYLVHVPVLCALAGVLLPRWAPALGYNAASAALAGLVLAVSLALAALGTRFVDRPAVALARRAGRTAVPLIRLARRRVRGNQAGAAPVRPG
jgi:peptidoglycan/LPS O-acetylase OafA/YrhL